MKVVIDSRENLLTATASGRVDFAAMLALIRKLFDQAVENGSTRILLDGTALEGELSTLERYTLGEEAAKYQHSKNIQPRVALVGGPPAVDGFGALVSRNRGVNAMVFPTRCEALHWLKG